MSFRISCVMVELTAESLRQKNSDFNELLRKYNINFLNQNYMFLKFFKMAVWFNFRTWNSSKKKKLKTDHLFQQLKFCDMRSDLTNSNRSNLMQRGKSRSNFFFLGYLVTKEVIFFLIGKCLIWTKIKNEKLRAHLRQP